jgi:catechol 2,3-dioxygenase-like lactoylglutathione lyase family enzyme
MYNAYLGIRVANLERSLQFYTTILPFEERSRGDARKFFPDGGIYVHLEDPISKQTLELNWYPAESKHATPYSPGEGLDHIAFVVDDVEQAFNDLIARGVEPTEITP